jgi:hypothetical protein
VNLLNRSHSLYDQLDLLIGFESLLSHEIEEIDFVLIIVDIFELSETTN